jgi:hypothetical protein
MSFANYIYQQQESFRASESRDTTLVNSSDSSVIDSLTPDTAYNLNALEKIPHRKVELVQKKDTITTNQVLFDPTLRTNVNTTWPSLILTLATLLLAFTKAFGLTRFRQIYKSLFSYYSAYEVVREERVFFHRVNFSLFIIYLTTISLLIYYIASSNNSNSSTAYLFPTILFFVIASYLLKFTSNAVLGYLFSHEQMIPSYSYNVLLYNYLLGIVLIPSMALIYFSDFSSQAVLKYVIFPLIIIVLIIRFIRFFVIGISNNVSFLYIILYICTLEILPLVVLGKFFI